MHHEIKFLFGIEGGIALVEHAQGVQAVDAQAVVVELDEVGGKGGQLVENHAHQVIGDGGDMPHAQPAGMIIVGDDGQAAAGEAVELHQKQALQLVTQAFQRLTVGRVGAHVSRHISGQGIGAQKKRPKPRPEHALHIRHPNGNRHRRLIPPVFAS